MINGIDYKAFAEIFSIEHLKDFQGMSFSEIDLMIDFKINEQLGNCKKLSKIKGEQK